MQQEFAGIAFELQRRPVKNLRIKVSAPDGAVQVVAPRHLADAQIFGFVRQRADWIKKHQQTFLGRPRPPEVHWCSGEQHYLWGQTYRLQVQEGSGRQQVQLLDGQLQLRMRAGSQPPMRAKVMREFYRQQLNEQVPALLEKWQARMGVQASEWRSKQMKTRWGTCNIRAKRIWLNLELVKKPPACLEYVLVHELAHLLEASHNARFVGFMDRFLPDWRQRKEQLRQTP